MTREFYILMTPDRYYTELLTRLDPKGYLGWQTFASIADLKESLSVSPIDAICKVTIQVTEVEPNRLLD
jgi:hypothetical protein